MPDYCLDEVADHTIALAFMLIRRIPHYVAAARAGRWHWSVGGGPVHRFRGLVWGLIGTRYARFCSFAYGPRSVLSYVKSLFTRSPQHHLGHNPAGSWAIYALLALSLLAGASGYATYNDIGGHWMEDVHEVLANMLLGVVFVHIAGVLLSSLLQRENLVRAMLTGYKSAKPGSGIRYRHRIIGAALIAAVAVFWIAGTDSLPASFNPSTHLSVMKDHSSERRQD